MWIYLGARNAGAPKDWSRTWEGRCTPFRLPLPALPLDPTVPQRHLHSPTTRPLKQTELFLRILNVPRRGEWRGYSPAKRPDGRGRRALREAEREERAPRPTIISVPPQRLYCPALAASDFKLRPKPQS